MGKDTKNEKLAFWHALKIFNREMEEIEKEIKEETSVTDRHLDIHIAEAQEKADSLVKWFTRLFKKGE